MGDVLWIGSSKRRGRLATAISVAGVAFIALAGAIGVARSRAADPTALPLGDGDWTAAGPRIGYVYSCQTTFNGGGASIPGPWIDLRAGTWDSTEKIAVQGSNAFAGAWSARKSGATRVVKGNGLPKQPAGTFPVQRTDPAYQYDRNPNTIAASAFSWSLPMTPAKAASPSCLPMGAIGVLNDGVALFNGLDGMGRDAAAWEVLDARWGHPERTGQYHHHNVPTWMAPTTGTAHSPLVGYAKDGFGIYGPLGDGGRLLSNADLDACHGHTHAVTWNKKQVSIYHYHATQEFPYTLGCFAGTAVR